MNWKDSIKKEESRYDSASIRKKLQAIGEYRDSLVGKTFTAKENEKLRQFIMDLMIIVFNRG